MSSAEVILTRLGLLAGEKLESCHDLEMGCFRGYLSESNPVVKFNMVFLVSIYLEYRDEFTHPRVCRYAFRTLSKRIFSNLWILCLWPCNFTCKNPSCSFWCFSHFPQMCPKALEIHTITVDFFGSHINIPPIFRECSTVHEENGKWAPSPVTTRVVITPFFFGVK